ncbi:hypothetical protein Y886_14620 [Xanthomonas hyacinthi DSM 19077]|nr:hypothetical protein Y886_14620 [Xanthomonas hyacinthi DSM 19077]
MRLTHVRLFENTQAIAEISDCERTKDGGAILVWPRQHTERVSQLTDAQVTGLAEMIFWASSSLLRAYGPVAFHTFCSAGAMVGQSEAHAHFQIQPRYDGREYSFAGAADLPIIPLAEREAMALRLRKRRAKPALASAELSGIRFRAASLPEPSPQSGIDPRLVVDETEGFIAYCHPQSRGPGAVVIVAKRAVSCFLEFDKNERAEFLKVIRNVAVLVEEVCDPDGLSIWWDTGEAANHAFDEFIAEVVPRFQAVPYVPEYREDRSQIGVACVDELVAFVLRCRAVRTREVGTRSQDLLVQA